MATVFFIWIIRFRIRLKQKRYPIQKIINIRPDWTTKSGSCTPLVGSCSYGIQEKCVGSSFTFIKTQLFEMILASSKRIAFSLDNDISNRDEHRSGLDWTGSGLKPILTGSGLDRTEKIFVALM